MRHNEPGIGAGTDLRAEDAVTAIAPHAGVAPRDQFWARLQELADTRAIPRAFKPSEGLTLLPLQAYLPLVLDSLSEAASERPDGDWLTGLDLPRARDLEMTVFPRLAFALRRAVADGDAADDLLLVVIEFLVREQLRTGHAPVMLRVPVKQDLAA